MCSPTRRPTLTRQMEQSLYVRPTHGKNAGQSIYRKLGVPLARQSREEAHASGSSSTFRKPTNPLGERAVGETNHLLCTTLIDLVASAVNNDGAKVQDGLPQIVVRSELSTAML